MSAYYQLIRRDVAQDGSTCAYYCSNVHAQGAWNPHEQHMAPATGIISYELEQFMPRPDLRIGRVSLDIYGLIAFGEFSIHTKVIRAGKTIELIEASMQANGKTCIVARAWRMMTQDTTSIQGLEDVVVQQPEQLPVWMGMRMWPGGFIQSINARCNEAKRQAGRGLVWVSTELDMVEGTVTSDFCRSMGMIDMANGIVPRQSPKEWAFPNLDLQIHLHRLPRGPWLGLETVQQYGADGIGLTSSVLHDIYGPFGRSEQILTLRAVG